MQPQDRQPLVSMTIFCYNHERFIEECLEGVRTQTYQHTELIIVDDASADKSVAVSGDILRRAPAFCGLRSRYLPDRTLDEPRTHSEAELYL
jgi:GT2 family glycosyltransferase